MTQCSDDNIRQTLFLGCSVEHFSCNLGFNEQPTEVNVRIVRDSCGTSDKIYYDPFGSVNQFEKTWSGVDPGFNIYGPQQDEPPQLGAPVYFRFGNFEFMGILQSWTKVQTKTDVDIYDVKIVSPVEILEGCQLIIGDYTGPVKGFNIFNVYGFQEVFSPHSLAPSYTDPRYPVDGPIMGSFSGAFGGANANKVGMTWNKIKEGLQVLTSSLIPASVLNYEEYTNNGRITFWGGQGNARFGLIPYDDINLSVGLVFGVAANLAYYILDISELPAVPDEYRLPGPNISILSLISQICNDFGMDYYLELVPVKSGGNILKVIKIRTILRNIQPDTTIVQNYIDSVTEVIDSSFGRELRNETTTTFLVGGQKQNIWQVENGPPDPDEDPEEEWLYANYTGEQYVRDRIVPYFGKDTLGNAYVLHTTSGAHIENGKLVSNISNDPNVYYINFDFRNRYNWIILDAILPDTVPVTIAEMRNAAESFDAWAWHTRTANTVFNQYITDAGFNVDTIYNPNILNNPRLQARDLISLFGRADVDQFTAELNQYAQIIGDIYRQSKQTFMVRAPWIVARYSIDSTTLADSYADLGVLYTDEPCEGGWTEASNVLYLPNPSTYVDRMRQEDGTIRSFAFFDLIEQSGISPTSHSIKEFESEESFAIDRVLEAGLTGEGKLVYYSFKQDLEPVFLDRVNLISPRVVIQFSQPLDFDSDDENSFFGGNGWGFNSQYLASNTGTPVGHIGAAEVAAAGSTVAGLAGDFTAAVANIAANSVEKELMSNKVDAPVREPDAVAITLKSNVHTYGPWKPDNIIEAGPPGKIRFEKQEDLVPWTFGSYANLDDVAQVRADEGVTVMFEGEVGTITVFGAPNIPLGSELASLQGLVDKFYPLDEHLIENRSLSFDTVILSDSAGASKTFNLPFISYDSWNGSFGPTVTSINIQFDTQGISTTYGFRTFTPKFGVLAKLNAQRLEQRYIFENHRATQQRFFNEARRVQQNYLKSLRQISSRGTDRFGLRHQPGTPHSVLVGQIVDGIVSGTTRSIIASKDLYELQNNLAITGSITGTGTNQPLYNKMAIMSWDGLVRPVSVTGGGGLPRFCTGVSRESGNLANSGVSFIWRNAGTPNIGNTAPPVSPMFELTGYSGYLADQVINILQSGTSETLTYAYTRTTDYFNPFSNPSGYNNSTLSRLHTGSGGHDIDIIARKQLIDMSGSTRSLVLSLGTGTSGGRDYANDYRFLAMRGPLVMHGWGYDTNGKPIPNSRDTEISTSGGVFESYGLTDRFLPDFLKKPHTWPSAPIDLRFDRRRGVWTVPPDYPIVDVELFAGTGLEEECPIIGHCSGLIMGTYNYFDSSLYNATGQSVPIGVVPVYKPSLYGHRYFKGDIVQAKYNVGDGFYHIVDAPPHNPWNMAMGLSLSSTASGGTIQVQILNPNSDCAGGGDLFFNKPSECLETPYTATALGTIAAGQTVIICHDRAFNQPCGDRNMYAVGIGLTGTVNITGSGGGGSCCDELPIWVLDPDFPQPITYTWGCGLDLTATTVSIEPSDIAGPGLQPDPTLDTACGLAVAADEIAGCGLRADPTDANNVKLAVHAEKIAGLGLEPDTVTADNTPAEDNACAIGLHRDSYVATTSQLYGHVSNGDFKHNTIDNWLLELDSPAPTVDLNKDQYVGHRSGGGNVTWLDDGTLKVEEVDGFEYLIDKIDDTSTYNSSNHQVVYGQVVGSSPSKNVKFFTNKTSTIHSVIITGTISAASYNSGNGTLTPSSGIGVARIINEGNPNEPLTTGEIIVLRNIYPSSIVVQNGQSTIGKAIFLSGSVYDLLTIDPGNTQTKVALIENDISGIVENTGMKFGANPYYAFTPTVVTAKYFIQSGNSLIIATGAGSTYLSGTFYYDDAKPFYVNTYTRADYTDYPENNSFPPTGYPVNYFNKKYRVETVNGRIQSSMCRPLPPPPLYL